MWKNKFVTLFLVVILGIPILSFAEADDYKDIFAERLVRAYNSYRKWSKELLMHYAYDEPDEATIRMSTAEAEKLCDDLWNFANEYPSSKFADDAKRVAIDLSYVISSSDIKQQSWLKKMEEFAARSPDGKLDDFTIQEIDPYRTDGNNLMPNSVLLLSWQASNTFLTKDFESAVKYSSLFKDKIEQINDPSGVLARQKKGNYMLLGRSYKKMGKPDAAINIFKEAESKFSDSAIFKESIEEIERDLATK